MLNFKKNINSKLKISLISLFFSLGGIKDAYSEKIDICDTIGFVSKAIMYQRISSLPKEDMLEKAEKVYEKGSLSHEAHTVIKQLIDKAYQIEITEFIYENADDFSSSFAFKYKKDCYDQRS